MDREEEKQGRARGPKPVAAPASPPTSISRLFDHDPFPLPPSPLPPLIAMSPAVASSAASSQRNTRGGRGSAAWAAGGGGSSSSSGSAPKGKPTTAAASRFWVQTLNRERANELQLRFGRPLFSRPRRPASLTLTSPRYLLLTRQRSYGLSILQQPEKARLSSFKDSSDTCERSRGPDFRLSADHPASTSLPLRLAQPSKEAFPLTRLGQPCPPASRPGS